MTAVVVTLVVVAVVALGAWKLATHGVEAGDLPGDAASRVELGRHGCEITVINPGSTEVVVGATFVRKAPTAPRTVAAPLVIRPGRWTERRRDDRGADRLLGAAPRGNSRSWLLPAPQWATHVRVVLGQPGGRLRVHQHRLPAVLVGSDWPWSVPLSRRARVLPPPAGTALARWLGEGESGRSPSARGGPK